MSLEWQPQVVRIEKVIKHPDADNLEIATVLGDYPVVIKTGEFKEGELAAYINIDSIVPDTEQFYFLCPKAYEKYEENGEIKQRQIGPKFPVGQVPEKNRIIKAKKIRGVYSQGMLVSPPPNISIGQSVVEYLGLKKWEEEEEDNIPNAKRMRGANAEKAPKGWSIPYYDIESVRKNTEIFNGMEVVLCEKLHGSNASFCHDEEKLHVKSRNFYKKKNPEDPWWDIAIRYNLEEKLKSKPHFVFFGELIGFVKNFRYDCEIVNEEMQSKIKFFDIFDVKKMQYLDYDPMLEIFKELELEPAPEIYRGEWLGKEAMYKFAEGLTLLGGKHIREGYVVRPTVERKDPKFNRLIRKLVGEGYNLQK